MSTFDDILLSYLSSNSFSMEDTLEFSFDPAAEVESLSFPPSVEEKACLPVVSPQCGSPGNLKTELISTPGLYEESELAEHDLPVIPESELSIDDGLRDQLIEVGISEFNKRVKALGLDATTVQILRTQRKKDKNRLAAIRSRARKETRLSELEKRVIQLQSENKSQQQLIAQLQARLRKAEQDSSKGN